MYTPENPEWASWSQAPLQPGPLAFAPYPGQAARSGAPWSAPQQRPAAGFAPSSGDPQFYPSWGGEWEDPDGWWRRRRFRRFPFDKFRKRPFDKFGKFDKFDKFPFDKFGKRRKF